MEFRTCTRMDIVTEAYRRSSGRFTGLGSYFEIILRGNIKIISKYSVQCYQLMKRVNSIYYEDCCISANIN